MAIRIRARLSCSNPAFIAILVVVFTTSCGRGEQDRDSTALARAAVEVTSAVAAFHAADTARNADAVIGLLWREFSIMVDGHRQTYDEVVAGSRQFMATLELFHTEWTDLRVTPLTRDYAIASFQFRDSLRQKDGALIRARGPTTFIWQRRKGEWRVLFADADHYPVEP